MASVYFDPAVGGNGSVVTDDSNPSTGLANGGHRTRFVPALGQVVAVAQHTVNEAAAANVSADEAKDWANKTTGPVSGGEYSAKFYAQAAMNSPGTQATSTTSLAIGTGSKSLTLAQTGKAFVVGQYVQVVNSTNAWMVGLITSFDAGTGAMTVDVINTGGTGTFASWVVTPASPPDLPSQTGNSGKFLQTSGSVASWVVVPPEPVSATLTYAQRGTLRSVDGATTNDTYFVESLGAFIWVAGSTEIDDDETCFATTSGRWLLYAAAWDLVADYVGSETDWLNVALDDLTDAVIGKALRASYSYAVTSIAANTGVTFDVTVSGAAVGDFVSVSPPLAVPSNLLLSATVSAANTVQVQLWAATSAANPSGTYEILVIKGAF